MKAPSSQLVCAVLGVLLLCSSCVQWSTGTSFNAPPIDFPSTKPTVRIEYPGVVRPEIRLQIESALGETESFGVISGKAGTLPSRFERILDPDKNANGVAEAVLEVRAVSEDNPTIFVLLNSLFLWLLPVPVADQKDYLVGSWIAGDLEPHAILESRRTIYTWGGIPLIPFSIIFSADRSELRQELAEEFAQKARFEYATYARESWDRAVAGGTQEARQYVDAFRSSHRIDEANALLETRLHADVLSGGAVEDYFDYLDRFGGARAAALRSRGRDAVWRAVESDVELERLVEYRHFFPRGDSDGRATNRIDDVAWARATDSQSVEDYQLYLRLVPEGSRAGHASETLAWDAASRSGMLSRIDEFLTIYPDGEHASSARAARDYVARLHSDGTYEGFQEIVRKQRVEDALDSARGRRPNARWRRDGEGALFIEYDVTGMALSGVGEHRGASFVLRDGAWVPLIASPLKLDE